MVFFFPSVEDNLNSMRLTLGLQHQAQNIYEVCILSLHLADDECFVHSVFGYTWTLNARLSLTKLSYHSLQTLVAKPFGPFGITDL